MEKNELLVQVNRIVKSRQSEIIKELETIPKMQRRIKAFAKFLETNLPPKVYNRSNIYIVESGGNWFWAKISSKYKTTEHDTKLITAFCAENDKWRFTKSVETGSGKWKHTLRRELASSDYVTYHIDFIDTAEVDGCKLIKKEKTEVYYEVEC